MLRGLAWVLIFSTSLLGAVVIDNTVLPYLGASIFALGWGFVVVTSAIEIERERSRRIEES